MRGFGSRGWSGLRVSDRVGRDSALHFEAIIGRYRNWSRMERSTTRKFKVWIAVAFVECKCGGSHLCPIRLFLSNILCHFVVLISWHRFGIWKHILVFKVFLYVIWSCLILFNSSESWLLKDLSRPAGIPPGISALCLALLFLRILRFLVSFWDTGF